MNVPCQSKTFKSSRSFSLYLFFFVIFLVLYLFLSFSVSGSNNMCYLFVFYIQTKLNRRNRMMNIRPRMSVSCASKNLLLGFLDVRAILLLDLLPLSSSVDPKSCVCDFMNVFSILFYFLLFFRLSILFCLFLVFFCFLLIFLFYFRSFIFSYLFFFDSCISSFVSKIRLTTKKKKHN